MSIDFRDAQPEDAPAIAELFASCFTDTFRHLYRPQDLEEFLATMSAERFGAELADARFEFRVATADGALVGYAKLGPPELPVEALPATLELSQLYVLKRFHGSGIATTLMEWLLTRARALGAEHVQLGVYIDNLRARRFYERHGFHAVGRYDFRVGSHTDEDIVLRHVVLQADR